MVEQRARPGVEHREHPGTRPEVARVGGELEERGGGRGHEQAVDELLMRPGERPQLGRQGEGEQEVGAGQQAGPLPVQPAPGLVPVTRGAVPVATGVVAVLAGAAVITRPDVPAEGGGATGGDVAQGAALRGQQRGPVEPLVDLAHRANDVRELEHGRPGRSEALHQPVDRIDGGLADLRREVGIDLRGPGARVAEVGLDEAEIHAGFEQMGRVGVPQRVDVGPLVHAALLAGPDKGRLQTRAGNRAGPGGDEVARALAKRRGKQPLRRAVGAPVRAQQGQRVHRQGDVAVAPALAMDVQQPSGAVHVGDLEVGALHQAQPADVDGRQARPVDRQPDATQDAAHLVATQDDRELLLPDGPHQAQQLPLAAQAALVEELDAAQRDGETGPGEVLDIGEVEEVLAEIVLGEPIGRRVEVSGELPDGVGVGLLGARREPAELHVLEHALAKWRHGVPFPGGRWDRPEQDAP